MKNVQWKKMKLGDCCSSELGKTLDEGRNTGKYRPYLCALNVLWGKIDTTTIKQMRIEDEELNRYLVKKGDLLVCEGGEIGRCAIWDSEDEIYYQNALHRVRFYDGYDSYFFMYLLCYYNDLNLIDKFGKGLTIKHLNQTSFRNIPVSVPSLPAQRRIAAILSTADKVIEQTRQLIGKYKSIKQGMMEDLLKPKEGWKKVKLGEVGDIVTGSTPTTTKLEYWDGEYNFYSPADFDDNVYCAKTDRTITTAGLKTGRQIPANSIMVACIASIGKIAINRTTGITNQQINTIIPYEGYNFMFLYYLLLYNVKKIKSKAAQTTIPIINKDDFSNLEFRVPDLPEQRRIAKILSGIDRKIEAEEKVLEKYEKMKKGLMEKLLGEKHK